VLLVLDRRAKPHEVDGAQRVGFARASTNPQKVKNRYVNSSGKLELIMFRKQSFWNSRHTATRKSRKKNSRSSRRRNSYRSTMLGVEWLEDRVVLSANPVLTVVSDQVVDEGAELIIENIGTFTDDVEATYGGGPAIGLDPIEFTTLAIMNDELIATATITVDTDALEIYDSDNNVMASGATKSVGTHQVAVFAFQNFEVAAGVTVKTTGPLPIAILALNDITIAGTIDVSARAAEVLGLPNDPNNHEQIAGPGGGNGGLGNNGASGRANGAPAVGAPSIGAGQWFSSSEQAAGGTGGGFGGRGGAGERTTGVFHPQDANNIAGQPYGNLLMTAVQGGSGGSTAAGFGTAGTVAGGGGGGGGIELGAVNTVTITGQILADGGDAHSVDTSAIPASEGNGGGGAGGGILVHAKSVVHSGTLSAKGGRGGGINAAREGGGGGGGRIVVVYSQTGPADETGMFVDGGDAGGDDGLGNLFATGVDGTTYRTSQTPSTTPASETYEYFIDWGDGSTPDTDDDITIDTAGSVGGIDRAGSFDGSHTYSDNGLFPVIVRLADSSMTGDFVTGIPGVDFVEATFDVTVNNVAPTATLSNTGPINEGGSASVNFTGAFDPSIDDTTAGFDYAYDFGNDGSFDIGDANYGGVVAGASAAIPTSFLADDGDVTVRARIIDKDGGFTEYFTVIEVNNVAPTLTISGSLSVDEDVAYTLNLSSDSDPGTDTISEWEINWGDGNVETVSGDPTTAPHTYANGGVYTISATATDEDGTFGCNNTLNVTVNDVVVVPTIGSFLVGTVLNVIGASTGNNMVTISQSNGTITVDGSFNTPNSISFTSPVTEIVVQMGSGNDIVIASSSITAPMTIDAGGGNDLITTGNGNDVVSGGPGIDILYGQGGDDVLLGGTGSDDLLGGNGDDVLIGGNGVDLLFGGNGRDLLIGSADEDLLSSGNGEDILIGGTTSYDDYDTDAKKKAIDDVMDIWTSTDGFDTRVADLNLSGLLQVNGTDNKVFDDNARDVIIGGAGRDLVFGDDNASLDGVTDLISLIPMQDQLISLT
jgi:hypothetical protein